MTQQATQQDVVKPVRVKISDNWKRFIIFCQNQYPEGQVCVRMSNGMPQELISEYTKRRVRFDRAEPSAISFTEPKQ